MLKLFLKNNFSIPSLRLFAFMAGFDRKLYYKKLSLEFKASNKNVNNNLEFTKLDFVTFEEMNKSVSEEIYRIADIEMNYFLKRIAFRYISIFLFSIFILLLFLKEVVSNNLFLTVLLLLLSALTFFIFCKSLLIKNKLNMYKNKLIEEMKSNLSKYIDEIIKEGSVEKNS